MIQLQKDIQYWTDWQNGVSLLTGCSNINHGLRADKDGVVGLICP